MSSIDKTSVRDQVNQLKADFHRLSASEKLSLETKTLVLGLLTLVEIMLAVFMEKKTPKNSKNSSIPPSQTEPDQSATSSSNENQAPTKKRRANKGSFGNQKDRVHTRTISVDFCETCSEDLSEQPVDGLERRTTIDIVFEKVTKHVDAEIKTCPQCDTVNKGRFPDNMPGPVQYGHGLRAYMLNLIIVQMVALNRVQQMVYAFIGQMVSEATMLKYTIQLYWALEKWENEAFDWMLNQAVVNTDETSLKVNKKKQWIHVCSSGDVTLKFLHPKRGKEAIKEINFIPKYGGTIIHDCWASYLSYPHCQHGLCGSHLLRELTFIVESNHYRWAANMKRLLKQTCKMVSKRKRKKLTQKEYDKLQRRYRHILTRGENEMPAIPPKPKTQRGKMAKSDAHNLWERLQTYEEAVLLFAKLAEVPFTNNRAERDLRMSKVKQKVSGCFRVEKYAKAYCRISSYLQTMSAKGYNSLAAIEMAITGEIYNTKG